MSWAEGGADFPGGCHSWQILPLLNYSFLCSLLKNDVDEPDFTSIDLEQRKVYQLCLPQLLALACDAAVVQKPCWEEGAKPQLQQLKQTVTFGLKNVLLSWSICILTPLLLVLLENDFENTWRQKNQNFWQHYSKEEWAEIDLMGTFQYLWGGYQSDWTMLFTVIYGRRGWGLWAEVETIEIPLGIGKKKISWE